MTSLRQSTPPRSRVPNGFITAVALLALGGGRLSAQGSDRMPVSSDFYNDPGDTALGTLAKNAAVDFGRERDGWREVTVRGWVKTDALQADSRDGFDVSAGVDHTPVRNAAAADAPVRASVRLGVLFDRLSTKAGWTEVRRTGWTRTTAAASQTPPPPPPPPAAAAPTQSSTTQPANVAATDSSLIAVLGGSSFSAEAGGSPTGSLEATSRAELRERRDGWTRVLLDVWVKDAAVAGAPAPGGITGRDVRESPDRYVGQAVEWELQVLAVQQADELRPELPLGQPYVLARGPLPETGFVYLLIQPGEVEAWRTLDPLATVRVRATVKAGRTRYLPTPVIELVRRLD